VPTEFAFTSNRIGDTFHVSATATKIDPRGDYNWYLLENSEVKHLETGSQLGTIKLLANSKLYLKVKNACGTDSLSQVFSVLNIPKIQKPKEIKTILIQNATELNVKYSENIKDVNKLPNILQANGLFKHLQFDRNLLSNINEQYIRQVAKMLSDSFIEMKKKLNVKSFSIDTRPLRLKTLINTYQEILGGLRKIDREAFMIAKDDSTEENLQKISDIWEEFNIRVENNTLVINERYEKIRKKINSLLV
jgi:hypothetical protein